MHSPDCPRCEDVIPWRQLLKTVFPWKLTCGGCDTELELKLIGVRSVFFGLLVGIVAWGMVPDAIESATEAQHVFSQYTLIAVGLAISERLVFLGNLLTGGKFKVTDAHE